LPAQGLRGRPSQYHLPSSYIVEALRSAPQRPETIRHSGGVGSRSPSCARYTIVNIRWKRTQRDFSGNLLKTASIKGSINSTPLACHKYLQHSINFISAASPPAVKNGSISFTDSAKPRLSSSSTTFFPSIVRSLTAVTLSGTSKIRSTGRYQR